MQPAINSKVRVALIEDDPEARTRLQASIAADSSLELEASYTTGAEALAGLESRAPDVLLVDLGLPDIPGLDIVRYVAERHPQCDILVVTIFGDQSHVIAAFQAGARGYLLKGGSSHDIAIDIHDLRHGGSPLSPAIARQVLDRLQTAGKPARASEFADDGEESRLSAREAEILNAISRGFSYVETARMFGIGSETVHTYLKRVYRKLQVHSKTEAVFEASRRGLL